MTPMKLFVWEPTGHGNVAFSVMAITEDHARQLVDDHVRRELSRPDRKSADHELKGWGDPDYYTLMVFEPGQVAEVSSTNG